MNKIRKAAATLMLMSSANAVVGIRDIFCCCPRRQEGGLEARMAATPIADEEAPLQAAATARERRAEEFKIITAPRYTIAEAVNSDGSVQRKTVTIFPARVPVPVRKTGPVSYKVEDACTYQNLEIGYEVTLLEKPELGRPLKIMVIADMIIYTNNIPVKGKEYITYSDGEWKNNVSGQSKPYYKNLINGFELVLYAEAGVLGEESGMFIANAANGFRPQRG